MRTRQEVDSELHTLRTAIGSLFQGKERQAAEHARFRIFQSFERGDRDGARRWLRAVRASFAASPSEETLGLMALAYEALDALEEAIDSEPGPVLNEEKETRHG